MIHVIDMLDQLVFSKDAKKGNISDVVTARIIFLFRNKMGTPKNTTQILTLQFLQNSYIFIHMSVSNHI